MGRFAAVVKTRRGDTSMHRNAADELLRQFYEELMAAVMPFISTSGLIIVPHGILCRVPFHAFHDGSQYLADLFDISYAPSGSVLKYCLDRPDVDDSSALQLTSKPSSSIVANFMHMPARVALRQDNPVLSRLEFADGSMCIPDVYASRWETNLLSLCAEDSYIDIGGGIDGLQGLVRSLLYAGCRSVLVELWKVRSEPSERFFAEFYSEWLAGKTKQLALAAAQEDLRKAYPHPFDWAPFILSGRR
jgi:CHAT domain-containing protein